MDTVGLTHERYNSSFLNVNNNNNNNDDDDDSDSDSDSEYKRMTTI
jgi:hypothetical protein